MNWNERRATDAELMSEWNELQREIIAYLDLRAIAVRRNNPDARAYCDRAIAELKKQQEAVFSN